MKNWYDSIFYAEINAILSKIVIVRKEKGISQHKMVSTLGLGQPGYAKMEKGKTRLDMLRFIAILRLFEMSYEEFFKDIKDYTKDSFFKEEV